MIRGEKNADTFRFVNLPFNLNVSLPLSFFAFLPLFPSFNRLFFLLERHPHPHRLPFNKCKSLKRRVISILQAENETKHQNCSIPDFAFAVRYIVVNTVKKKRVRSPSLCRPFLWSWSSKNLTSYTCKGFKTIFVNWKWSSEFFVRPGVWLMLQMEIRLM